MFFGKPERNIDPLADDAHIKFCSPHIYISNEVFFTSNGDRMPRLHPQEVHVPIYPNRAHSFGASSPRVRFLDVYGFPLSLNNK